MPANHKENPRTYARRPDGFARPPTTRQQLRVAESKLQMNLAKATELFSDPNISGSALLERWQSFPTLGDFESIVKLPNHRLRLLGLRAANGYLDDIISDLEQSKTPFVKRDS